jgi:hypothetical protein
MRVSVHVATAWMDTEGLLFMMMIWAVPTLLNIPPSLVTDAGCPGLLRSCLLPSAAMLLLQTEHLTCLRSCRRKSETASMSWASDIKQPGRSRWAQCLDVHPEEPPLHVLYCRPATASWPPLQPHRGGTARTPIRRNRAVSSDSSSDSPPRPCRARRSPLRPPLAPPPPRGGDAAADGDVGAPRAPLPQRRVMRLKYNHACAVHSYLTARNSKLSRPMATITGKTAASSNQAVPV